MDKRISSTEIASAETVIVNNTLQNPESQNCKIHKCHIEKDAQNEESTHEMENVSAIYVETSDEDDAEGLSGDKRTEIQLPIVTDQMSTVERECASALHERAQKLWSEMTSLREKLDKETALWRKEKEEFQLLHERSNALAFEEATARAAAVYGVESPFSNDLKGSIRELAILEYEKNLAKYHDQYSFEQAEQRYNSYKRMLADAYKQKLLEVERLCDEELENIRQNASCLQSFKEIASQWSLDENDHGDSQRSCDQPDAEQSKIIETSLSNDWCIYGKIDNEVNMFPEILSARFKQEEAT